MSASEIETDARGLLVILPRAELDAAVSALSEAGENLWIVLALAQPGALG